MKVSIYTGIQNGLFFDFHVVAMLRHHLPLADEIVVDEGYSTDGTYEAIKDIDSKIKVFRNVWDRSDPRTWHIQFKNRARQQCRGDWCILLDSDEFIPEWEWERLRSFLEVTEYDVLPVRFKHFYGNYKVLYERHDRPFPPPKIGYRIHRNLPTIEVWGDGANVRDTARPWVPPPDELAFEVHHFGEVRNPARLRQKGRTQARQHDPKNPRWDWMPSWLFDLFPHRWEDPDIYPFLRLYEGPYIKAVRENPDEFVRDGMRLCRLLERKTVRASS